MKALDIAAAGDHFIVGLRPTAELHPRDRALLADLRPAGVVLFKSNFLQDRPYEEWLESHRRLIAEIRAATGRDRMLIAIDHEGGRVCRTPPPVTRFSYAVRWASSAAAVGRAMGLELASLGINLNFAPVLDIHSTPANPVIGPRAFGDTADTVTAAALAFMDAMQREGVLACGKHFPGHGDTDKDSHRELPVLQQSMASLRARELEPFRRAIHAGIPMIMTSHLLVPQVDGEQPVTLSKVFNQDLLRSELGFDGAVVTDDIGMHAVSKLFDDPLSAVRLLLAGADLMMVCAHWTDTERCRGFARAVVSAQRSGEIPSELSASSIGRIAALLARAPQHEVRALSAEDFAAHKEVAPLFAAETAEVV